MVRRSLSMVLAACLLLTQSAAVFGHAHAGRHLEGHDPRPHFHTEVFETDSDHDEPAAPHDEDAVYVTCLDAVAAEQGGVSYPSDDLPVGFTEFDNAFSACHGNVAPLPRQCLHPPDHPVPLYLRLLTLLI